MTAVLIFAMNLCSLCRDFFDRQRSTRIARQQRHAGLVMRYATGRDAVEIKAQARFEIFATVTLSPPWKPMDPIQGINRRRSRQKDFVGRFLIPWPLRRSSHLRKASLRRSQILRDCEGRRLWALLDFPASGPIQPWQPMCRIHCLQLAPGCNRF